MSAPSAEPALYDVDMHGVPTLVGVRDATGFVSYPAQEHGSQLSGDHGERLTRVALAGTGTITAVVDVYLPLDPALGSPYRLAAVLLDEGPLLRCPLADAGEARSGDRVRAVTVPVVRGDRDLAELRFTLLDRTESA